MNLLNIIKNIFLESKGINKTNNYYFERHNCKVKNEEIKINMDFIIKKENDKNIIKFGMCPYCKEIFFSENFEDKLF